MAGNIVSTENRRRVPWQDLKTDAVAVRACPAVAVAVPIPAVVPRAVPVAARAAAKAREPGDRDSNKGEL